MPVSYRIALLLHLCALISAVVASALGHTGGARAARARRLGDVLQWMRTGKRVAIVFPVSVLVFLLTGAYMIQVSGAWSWKAGWIIDGIIGAVLLLILGRVIGGRQKAYGKRLAAYAKIHSPEALPLPLDPVPHVLAWVASGIALGVVCVMTIKPELIGGLALIVVGAVAGAIVGRIEHASHPEPNAAHDAGWISSTQNSLDVG
jgi:hypothetical protein